MMHSRVLLLALVGCCTALTINKGSVSHEKTLALVKQQMSSDCTVTIDAKTKTLHLSSNVGNYTVKDGKFYDMEDKKVGDMAPKALVCLGNKEAPDDGPAFFWVSSGAGYLYKKTVQGAPIDFLMNKHCWAQKNNVQYYLMLGAAEENHEKRASDATPCKDGSPGNHYFVVAGMHKLLEERKNSWIVSMDISDTFFTKAMFDRNLLNDYLDDNFDFIGGATAGGTDVFINGAIVAGKTTAHSPWAANMYSEWFKNRCGAMNQLAMWASLFKIWSAEDENNFSVDWKKMSSYRGHSKPGKPKDGGARTYARKHSGSLLKTQEEKDAHDEWCKSGRLSHNLAYPHVLVHANVGYASVNGVAFRSDIDRSQEPFVCHNTWDRHVFDSCNAKKSMCKDDEQCKCEYKA